MENQRRDPGESAASDNFDSALRPAQILSVAESEM